MSSPTLEELYLQLERHTFRTWILYFELLSNRNNSRLHWVLNKHQEFHLNNCVWSHANAIEGPANCLCSTSNHQPVDRFFEMQSHLTCSTEPLTTPTFWPVRDFSETGHDFPDADVMPLVDFYNTRVLDADHIAQWVELYWKIEDVLKFRLSMRTLGIEHKLDAILNPDSQEWHLTDCERSVRPDSGRPTCHCRRSMKNPNAYVRGRYLYSEWDMNAPIRYRT